MSEDFHPEPQVIRDRFRAFLGDEQYRNFIMATLGMELDTRLPFWHEYVWKRFVTKNPDCCLDFPQIVSLFNECPLYGHSAHRVKYFSILSGWLIGNQLSLQEVEQKNMHPKSRSDSTLVPFGFDNAFWKRISSKVVDGDWFQEYRSPPETWENLCGEQGYALIHNAKVIDRIITLEN